MHFMFCHVFFKESLSCLKVQKLTLGIRILFVLLFMLFLPRMGHRMMANGLVGSGSGVISFPIA